MDDLSKQTNSYMSLRFHVDGEEFPRELKVPTFWDNFNKKWLGTIKTPESHTLMVAKGDNSKDLQDNFIKVIHELLSCADTHNEVLSMFVTVKE